MISIFGILIATGSVLQSTNDLQKMLDNNAGVYVMEANYIAAHSHRPLGRKITMIKQGTEFDFNGKVCKVTGRVTVNYRKQTMSVLTGADLYLQTCVKGSNDLAYLIKAKCEKNHDTKKEQ